MRINASKNRDTSILRRYSGFDKKHAFGRKFGEFGEFREKAVKACKGM